MRGIEGKEDGMAAAEGEEVGAGRRAFFVVEGRSGERGRLRSAELRLRWSVSAPILGSGSSAAAESRAGDHRGSNEVLDLI